MRPNESRVLTFVSGSRLPGAFREDSSGKGGSGLRRRMSLTRNSKPLLRKSSSNAPPGVRKAGAVCSQKSAPPSHANIDNIARLNKGLARG
jgi:hypothetical protein